MNKTIAGFFLVLILSFLVQARPPYVLVLGTAQDAGAPQMGCMSPFCRKAFKDRRLKKLVSSIALIDPDSKQRWIFDATPDLPQQFQILKRQTGDFSNRLDGIFLTHAHIGHYTGLMFLGRESMSAKSVPVYAMPRMKAMLENNAPWSQLVNIENIALNAISDGKRVQISQDISVTAFLVPHRDEFSETVGYKIETAKKKLVFIPDIDKWHKWKEELANVVKANDYVFVDATFYAEGEIPRPMSEVPHPFVSETIDLLRDLTPKDKQKVHFIHFNHSNPLIQGSRKHIKEVERKGFKIASEGQIVGL